MQNWSVFICSCRFLYQCHLLSVARRLGTVALPSVGWLMARTSDYLQLNCKFLVGPFCEQQSRKSGDGNGTNINYYFTLITTIRHNLSTEDIHGTLI